MSDSMKAGPLPAKGLANSSMMISIHPDEIYDATGVEIQNSASLLMFINGMRSANNTLRKQHGEDKASIELWRNRADDRKKTPATVADDVDDAERIGELSRQLTAVQQKLDSALSREGELAQKLELLQAQFDESIAQRDELQEENADVVKRFHELECINNTINTDRDRLTAEHNALLDTYRETYNAQQNQLKQLDTLTTERNRAFNGLNNLIASIPADNLRTVLVSALLK